MSLHALSCPTCCVPLNTVEYEGQHIETCPACKGEFVAGFEMSAIIASRQQRFEHEPLPGAHARGPANAEPMTREHPLRCPGCSESMRTINFAHDTGVFVDRCDHCSGLWLEAEELEHIQALLERWEDDSRRRIAGLGAQLHAARHAHDPSGALAGTPGLIRRFVERLADRAA